MTRRRVLLFGVLVALATIFLLGDLRDQFGLAQLKLAQDGLVAWRAADPLRAGALFFLLCAAMTGLSLPVAGIMMLGAGAVFGLLWGTVLALCACTTGAVLAFLAARYLFREAVESRFGDSVAAINRGIERDGAAYLFLLRLTLVIPFFVVNPLAGLTRIGTGTFILTTLAGLPAGAIIFANAGTELARINTPADVLSVRMLVSLAALGVFPLVARKAVDHLRRR